MADKWSQGGQIFFCDSYAYGLNSGLQTFKLGTEDETTKLMASRRLTDSPSMNRVLILEHEEAGKAPAIPTRRHQSHRKRFL